MATFWSLIIRSISRTWTGILKRGIILLQVLVIVTACGKITSQEPLPITQSNTPEPTPTQLSSPTSTNEVLTSSLITFCPETREVPFIDLGLGPNTVMILLPSNAGQLYMPTSSMLWMQSSSEAEPRPISLQPPLAPESGSLISRPVFSPNNQWMAFLHWQENSTSKELWVSSTDGGHVWKISTVSMYSYASWVSDNELVIVGYPSEWNETSDSPQLGPPPDEYIPLFFIDPFTMEEHQLSSLPEIGIDQFPVGFILSNEIPYELLSVDYGEEYYLYNYLDGTYKQVFSWISGASRSLEMSLFGRMILMTDNEFTLVIERPYGIDIASNLDISSIQTQQNYDDVMQEVHLPEQDFPLSIVGLSNSSSVIAFKEFDEENFSYEPQGFYVFDYQTMELVNYCYATNARDITISPDGNFVAFTYYENPGSLEGDNWIEILNLHTGHLSTIPGFQMVGWGNTP